MASAFRQCSLVALLGAISVLTLSLTSGCATSADAADANRRRDLVVVPPDSQAVDSLRWSRVRSVRPLNQRMVLIDAERPYLLVLSQSCRGLQPNSVVIANNIGAKFQPRVDNLVFVDPFSEAAFNAGAGPFGDIATVSPSAGTGAALGQGGVVCQPETLYALDSDEAVETIMQAVSRKKSSS